MLMLGRGAPGVGSPEIEDSERRHAGHVRFGVVRQVNYANPPRVRVAIGDESDANGHLLTDWLPMATGRAGGDKSWHPLEIGEQVVVLSESGELQNGIVMPAGLHTSDNAAAGSVAGLWRTVFADGGSIEYNRATGAFTVDAKTAATLKVGTTQVAVTASAITLTVGGVSLAISSSGVVVTGGTITHDGKNVGKTHTHSGVQTGGGNTGAPV